MKGIQKMKKFICLMLAILMCASVSLAECKCKVPASVSIVAFKLATLNLDINEDEMNAISAIAVNRNDDCICSKAKLAMLHVAYRNYELIRSSFSDEMIDLLFEYIASCNCCDENEPTIEIPTQAKHVHRGGTHANNGTCSVCGSHYQKHGNGKYVKISNDKHKLTCSFDGCDYVYETDYHRTGSLIAIEENGVGRYKCELCNEFVWKYISKKTNCCDCCTHNCCIGCTCGCDFD